MRKTIHPSLLPKKSGEQLLHFGRFSAAWAVVINELMSDNASTAADGSGTYEDWIELYNPTSFPLSTAGLFLSDTLDPAAYWPLPAYSIPPESYLIIWADDDTQQGVAHASFKLSKAGTSLYLLNSNELVLDSVTLGPLAEDVSFARFPNATGSFAPRTPTFRRNNDESAPPKWPGNMYPVYPNPFSDHIFLGETDDVVVWSILGREVFRAQGIDRIDTRMEPWALHHSVDTDQGNSQSN